MKDQDRSVSASIQHRMQHVRFRTFALIALFAGLAIATLLFAATFFLDGPFWVPFIIGVIASFLILLTVILALSLKLESAFESAGIEVKRRYEELRSNALYTERLAGELAKLRGQLAENEKRIAKAAASVVELNEELHSQLAESEKRIGLATASTNELQALATWRKAAQQDIKQTHTLVADLSAKFTSESQARETLRVSIRDAIRNGRFGPASYKSSIFDPEVDLLEPLARKLKDTTAIDVGTNRGEFTASLRRNGFNVYAFEPNSALLPDLKLRFEDDPEVKIIAVAVGEKDGEKQLNLANSSLAGVDETLFGTLIEHPSVDFLTFESSINVPVLTLNSAFELEEVRKFGILKVDTEGYDLSVLAGATLIDAEALFVEFWDAAHPFNNDKVANKLSDYEDFIDRKRYPYCILMWRGSDENAFGLISDPKSTPPGSWGSVLYLQDQSTYEAVLRFARQLYGVDRVVDSTNSGDF